MVEVVQDGAVGTYADFDNRYEQNDARFGVSRTALSTLPIIDISPFMQQGPKAERDRVAREIRTACVNIGFFYIKGHGIPASELDALITWGHRFFELPLDRKMEIECNRSPSRQGFMRTGGLDPDGNPDKATDIKERLFISRDLHDGEPATGRYGAGQAQWPSAKVLPGFEAFVKDHFPRRIKVAQVLARAFSLSLGLPEDHFDPVYEHPGATLALNYYPPVDAAGLKETQWSFSPHTDYGTITVLSQDNSGGLQVRNSAGAWIDVPPVEGAFVINIGDLMAMWTNDLYTSNLHRAVNRGTAARFSAALFISPHGDTVVDCLPTCQGPDNPPRYAPVQAEEYNRVLIDQAYRTGRAGLAVHTAKRLSTN
jgi:isopenicillin N synthase-like dioxygenase